MGGRSGKGHTSGRVVKPLSRNLLSISSSALQTVGRVQGAEGGQFGFGQAVSHRDISNGNYDGGQRPCDLAAVKTVGLCWSAKRRINRGGATNNSLEMEADDRRFDYNVG